MRRFIPSVVMILLGTSLNADTFRAINWLYVVPLTPDTFEVIEDRGAGARGIWCAAADYVQAVGRDRIGQRMYILEPRRPSKTVPGRMGIVFTLQPDETLRNTPPSYSVTVRRRGENLPVHHARLFCDALIDEMFDGF